MQLPQKLTDKDDLGDIFCVLKRPIFRNFFRDYSMEKFSTKCKKHVFFTTVAPPTGNLWKIRYPTFVEDIFVSRFFAFSGKLNGSIFSQRPKREIFHYGSAA